VKGDAGVKNNRKKALSDIAAAMSEAGQNDKTDTAAGSLQDIISAALSEPNDKKRRKLLRDFAARRADVAAFIADNEDLINSEAEAALIGAAVGQQLKRKYPTKAEEDRKPLLKGISRLIWLHWECI